MDSALVRGFILTFAVFLVIGVISGEIFKMPSWSRLRAPEQKLITWGVSLVVINLILISLYPSLVADNAQQLIRYMALFPPMFLGAFGYHRLNLTEPLNLYALDANVLSIVVGSIFASIVAVEVFAVQKGRQKRSERSQPEVLREVLAGKLLYLTSIMLVFNLLIATSTVLGLALFIGEGYSLAVLLHLLVAPLFVHLFFVSTSFLISMVMARRQLALVGSVGLVVLLYLFNVVAYFESVMFLRFLSPFYYLSAVDIAKTGQVNPIYAVAVVAASLVLLTATYCFYGHREMAS